MVIEIGSTVQIKKDTVSQYSGYLGVVDGILTNSRYDLTVRFDNMDLLGFNEDELTVPKK